MSARLRQLLATHLRLAQLRANAHQAFTLGRGLTVTVYVDGRGRNHLKLSRLGVYPSASEWATVLRAWPQPVPEGVKPNQYPDGEHRCLAAVWEVPRVDPFGQATHSEPETRVRE